MNRPHSAQRGAALLTSLIMLVVLTLFVLSAMSTSMVNLRIAGNAQAKAEAMASAQQAIEQVASTNFAVNPQPTPVAVDINKDGTTDYSVAVAKPVCLLATPIRLDELDITIPGDQPCFTSASGTNTGIVGAPSGGNSLCSKTQWDVNATVSDTANTGATISLRQGIGVRVAAGTTC